MLDRVIAFSLKNRLLVLLAALALVVWGGYQAMRLPVEVQRSTRPMLKGLINIGYRCPQRNRTVTGDRRICGQSGARIAGF